MESSGVPNPAGLEVVEPTTTYLLKNPAGLEVVEPTTISPPEQPSYSAVEKEVYGSVAVAQSKFTATPKDGNPQRRHLLIAGIIAVALIILGAILGAVLGT